MPGARLIVNADDFGLTRGVNRAVIELYQAGALTSATLMATGPAFQEAVALARSNPGLGVGCHVVLTDGMPVSDPKAVPSLLGPDGKHFRPSLLKFFIAVLLGRVRDEEIALEAEAQIRRLQQSGLHVTHLDTHKHTHILPRVARALLRVAEQTGVRAIRNPFEHPWSLALSRSDTMRRVQVQLMSRLCTRFAALPQVRNGAVSTTDGTIGISATGHLNEACLRRLAGGIPEGLWELVCHPGYDDADLDQVTTRLRDTRDIERKALLAVFGQANPGPQLPRPEFIQLTHYGETTPATTSVNKMNAPPHTLHC